MKKEKALDIVIKCVVDQTRSYTRRDFVVRIKPNTEDYTASNACDSVESSLTDEEQQALKHLLALASWGTVDMVEVIDGDNEKPGFMIVENYTSKSSQQALFARFSHQALHTLSTFYAIANPSMATLSSPLMQRPFIILTGGLRTPGLIRSALKAKNADLLGI